MTVFDSEEELMKRIPDVVKVPLALVAMAVLLAIMPFTPGCFCVEETTGPPESISREYEGYMLTESEPPASDIFKLSVSFERGDEEPQGVITLAGDTTEYLLSDVELQGGILSFTATIPAVADSQVTFETRFDDRFLAGTMTTIEGTEVGSLFSVSVGDKLRTEFDMVGAYELVDFTTGADTVTAADSISVRLEFYRDGTFQATYGHLFDPDNVPQVETGGYSVIDDYLIISTGLVPEEQRTLPVSIRGYIVNKDLYILSWPRPFPELDALILVEDGIQVEHFKQVI
jgi:hypothetical protein